MSETKEQVVELDATAIEAIAKQVKAPEVDNDAIATLVAEKMLAESEKREKEASKLAGNKKEKAEDNDANDLSKLSKEEFTVRHFAAALGKTADFGKYQAHAMKTLRDAGIVQKATYMNAGTDADGGYFVPSAELLTDVLSVLKEYSSFVNELRVINLASGDSIDVTSLTADVVMTEVGSEGGAKAVTKPTIGDTIVTVREFAGIALLTKKLLKQSAIDVYAVLRDSFARAIAKKREELALTDSSSGIVTKSGVTVLTSASGHVGVANLTIAEIKSMPFQVPTASAAGGIYVFSRLLVGSLAGREDTTGQPILTLDANVGGESLGGTFNGYRFVVAETLGTSDAVSTVHAVFGNFKKYGILVRQGAVDSAVFDSGTVTDGGSVVHNLIQENKVAMRVEIWENVGYPIPSAFVRLRTSAS